MDKILIYEIRSRGVVVRFIPPAPAPGALHRFPEGYEVLAVSYNRGDPPSKLRGVVACFADYPEESEEAFLLRKWAKEQGKRRPGDPANLYRLRETEIHPGDRHRLMKLSRWPRDCERPEWGNSEVY